MSQRGQIEQRAGAYCLVSFRALIFNEFIRIGWIVSCEIMSKGMNFADLFISQSNAKVVVEKAQTINRRGRIKTDDFVIFPTSSDLD